MSAWKPKRFWSEAAVVPAEGGFAVELDGRPVKTPGKAPLVVPTETLARRIAAEWDAQKVQIDPFTMPFTRSANAALDKVTPQHAEIADLIAAYGDADLVCYRAPQPESLRARQCAAWDPLLDWAAKALDAPLRAHTGVMHIPQDAAALARLAEQVHAMDAFALTAMHDLVGMSGSLVLGFAALFDHKPADEVWAISRIDDMWQVEQWGADEEAMEIAARKQAEFLHAKAFADLTKIAR